MSDNAIDKKIDLSELKLGLKYPNRGQIHEKIKSFEIDVDYLEDDLDFNAEYFDCSVIKGEVEIFKDLEAGNLDTSSLSKDGLDGIRNALLNGFPHILNGKRENLANEIMRLKKI